MIAVIPPELMPDAPPIASLTGHVIIAGYGIVGRCVAETLANRGVPFCVVELNPATVSRLAHGPVPIIKGDVREKSVLEEAGFQRASALALAMPDEKQAMEALKVARAWRPEIPIIVRTMFSSAGMQVTQLGGTPVVGEQVVAREFASTLEKLIP